MKFDWYAATYDESTPYALMEAVRARMGIDQTEDFRPVKGYGLGQALTSDEGVRVSFQWGGHHDGQVHAAASGAGSEAFAEVIRQMRPRHRVTRADVAIDVAEPGSFDRLKRACREVADRHDVGVKRWDDDGRGRKGETLVCGSEKSVAMTRCYEKGKQFMTSGPGWVPAPFDTEETVWQLPHWTRLEVVIRPDKREAKERLASAEPIEFWGCSRWTKELVELVLGVQVERIAVGTVWRQSDTERAWFTMLAQYRNVIAAKLEQHGSWECLGLQMREDLAELDQAAQRLKRLRQQ